DPRRSLRAISHAKVVPKPRYGEKAVNALILIVAAGGAGWALLRWIHRAAGWRVMPFITPAFDGTSVLWSGAAVVVSVAAAITLAIAAARARPPSIGYGLAAVTMLVIGIAAVTVLFSVSPEGRPEEPPDGGRLVPWALPLVPLG